jgi:hypothetical protein
MCGVDVDKQSGRWDLCAHDAWTKRSADFLNLLFLSFNDSLGIEIGRTFESVAESSSRIVLSFECYFNA